MLVFTGFLRNPGIFKNYFYKKYYKIFTSIYELKGKPPTEVCPILHR